MKHDTSTVPNILQYAKFELRTASFYICKLRAWERTVIKSHMTHKHPPERAIGETTICVHHILYWFVKIGILIGQVVFVDLKYSKLECMERVLFIWKQVDTHTVLR